MSDDRLNCTNRMRVIESVGFYFPDSVGGSEVYVSSLVKQLRGSGIGCVVAAPGQSADASRYTHEGVEVFRYPFPERSRRGEAQGKVPPRYFAAFETWLREQRADVYHQHSWTTGCGHWHLEAAKRLGLKTVLSVHVPANICMRGTMLFEGRVACDGEIAPGRCGSCWLQWKGLPPAIAKSLAMLPENLGPLARFPKFGPVLAAKGLAATRLRSVHDMFAAADRIVAVCGWLHDALLANGAPSEKIVLIRQGVGDGNSFGGLKTIPKPSEVLRLGFLGRWDPLKGLHFLVEAFRRIPMSVPVALSVFAPAGSEHNEKYREQVRRAANSDARIDFFTDGKDLRSTEFLASIDALMVPSQWLETGPLVVLEAFAAGKPVVGSDIGGIKELVRHECNGLLVPHADDNAWTAAMVRMANDRGLVERLRQGIGLVRTMSDVAHDMAHLYRDLITVESYAV